jgi:serine/threonine protein phosphatase PrpC
MLGYYKMSLVGDSHLKSGNPVCQDASDVVTLSGGWVVAAVADGVGSAKYSQTGSFLAVARVLEFIEENKPERWHAESLKALMMTAFHRALKAIHARSSNDSNDFCDYDTTLTSVIYNGYDVVWGHVGDGGIIALTPFGEFKKLTDVQKGDSHNEVVPLRAGPREWVFGNSMESICALLLMTDGVYDVAVPWLIADKEMPINLRYVRWMMDTNVQQLKSKNDFLALQNEIRKFLGEHPNEIISDDKTVVGIINTDVIPETQPEEYYREPDWEKLRNEKNAALYQETKPIEKPENKPAEFLQSEPERDSHITRKFSFEQQKKTPYIGTSGKTEKNDDTKASPEEKHGFWGFFKK